MAKITFIQAPSLKAKFFRLSHKSYVFNPLTGLVQFTVHEVDDPDTTFQVYISLRDLEKRKIDASGDLYAAEFSEDELTFVGKAKTPQ